MSPGEWKSGGEGMTIRYGFQPSPFGSALVMATERGLAGLAFADAGEEAAALADMKRRWPKANYVEDAPHTAPLARRIFDRKLWRADRPLRVVLIGTDWEVRVWETLLQNADGPRDHLLGHRRQDRPAQGRARGRRRGRQEPDLFVVPCHRVIGKGGDLTGYHWGLTRKRAMLGWEAGKVGALCSPCRTRRRRPDEGGLWRPQAGPLSSCGWIARDMSAPRCPRIRHRYQKDDRCRSAVR